ncbi:MAG TPA: hypothetical protein P5556_03230 [Candidatus Gastranaerophilales bacterium]|nr:hypothetical protein [Candidatus Gastranaerophilales bacterium]
MSGYSLNINNKSYYDYHNRNNLYNNGYSSQNALMRRNNNAQQIMQYNNAVQGETKCPHGAPGGSCPLCMGKAGGGGGGGGTVAKRTGMSWGEAYYVWTRLKMAEFMTAEDRKLLQLARENNVLIQKFESSELLQKLAALRSATQIQIANLTNAISNLTQQVITSFKPAMESLNKVINVINHSLTKLIGVVEKLTAMLGEKIKLTEHLIRENIKKIMVKIVESEVLNRLIMIFNQKRQLFHDSLLEKIESLKEKIKKFLNMVNFITDENTDQGKQKQDKKDKRKNRW